MIGVEQLLGALGERMLEIVVVDELHAGVLVAEADLGGRIEPPQHVAALAGKLAAVVDRLTAAAHATAGARHDLDEVMGEVPVPIVPVAMQGLGLLQPLE